MVQIALVAAGIFIIGGVVLIGIATALTGIISTKKDGTTKTNLLWSSALSGLAGLLALVAGVIGIIYGGKVVAAQGLGKEAAKKKTRGWLIVFIIVIILVVILYVSSIVLNIVLRGDDELDAAQKKSMTAAIILAGIGLASVAIGSIILFVYARSKSKFKKF